MLLSGTKQRILFIAICGVALVALLVRIVSMAIGFGQAKAMQIPDKNGDSKDLCYLTDEMIKNNTQNYYSIRRSVWSKGNDSGVRGHFEKQDRDYIKTSFYSLSGFYVCNAFLGDGQPQKLTINSTVSLGNLRIVVTDEENNILFEVPIDENYELLVPTEDSEVYYVKLIAESAKLIVSVDRR